MTAIGIHDIGFATAHNVLDLAELARRRDEDVNKFYVGIGQATMSVPSDDEDIVTLGAAAAAEILSRNDSSNIRTLLFATESGIDQSKAAGVYAHRLLGMDDACRVVELKQACYAGTAALQLAVGMVARNPHEQVLVVASDVARYTRGSSGEATQGAAAVALLVTADPDALEVEPISGLHTDDIHDFWRPNYRSEAFVDGKYSIVAYLNSLKGAWSEYRARGGQNFEEIDRFCYHQPFTKMAQKAHDRLARLAGSELDASARLAQIAHSLEYNRVVGNSYTASLWVGLLSLLENDETDLAGKRIGMFSYGSGSVSEFFTLKVRPGYQQVIDRAAHQRMLAERTPIDYERYEQLHREIDERVGDDYETRDNTPSKYRFLGVEDHMRRYSGDNLE